MVVDAPQNVFVITLKLNLPTPPDITENGTRICPTCNQTFQNTRISHRWALGDNKKFEWGYSPRLEQVVLDVPAVVCGCEHVVFQSEVVSPIQSAARQIRDYLEFRKESALEESKKYLSPEDLAKLYECASLLEDEIGHRQLLRKLPD